MHLQESKCKVVEWMALTIESQPCYIALDLPQMDRSTAFLQDEAVSGLSLE